MKKIITFFKWLLLFVVTLLLYIVFKNPAERIYKINVIKITGPNALVEDFDGKLNNNYWNIVDREDNCNNELQYYYPGNVNIKNGYLEIKAKKEEFKDHHYTSGLIDTKDKFEFLYGKIIFRAKPAIGRGMLSAVWLLPADDSLLPEIDIVEILGTQDDRIWTGVHFLDFNSKLKSHFVNYVGNKDFSTYELDWEKNEIRFYVNNQLTYKTNVNIPDKKMYLIINLSVGGNWPKDPDESFFSADFLIDYIIVIPKEVDVT